jgi:hypothetical protein
MSPERVNGEPPNLPISPIFNKVNKLNNLKIEPPKFSVSIFLPA